MIYRDEDGFWQLPFGWSGTIHDDGWFLADAKRIIRFSGKVPNSGFQRPWWKTQ